MIFKNKIQNAMQKALDKYVKHYFPNLNTAKITIFYIQTLEFILTIISTIILIGLFTWYLPTQKNLTENKAIITLLCLILISLRQKNE